MSGRIFAHKTSIPKHHPGAPRDAWLRDVVQRIKDEEIRRGAAQREHERSPEGMRQTAIRTAAAKPGGIVSAGLNGFEDLDEFGPKKTNLLQ